MRALTLTQPWATLVAIGAKKIETRGWCTDYRGALAIHAAKSIPRDLRSFAMMSPVIMDALRGAGYRSLDDLPMMAVLCTVRVQSIERIFETTKLPDAP